MSSSPLPHDQNSIRQSHIHGIARVLSVLLGLPVLILIVFAITTPITASGALYVAGTTLAVVGMASRVWGYPRYRHTLWFGLGLIAAVVAFRLLLVNRSQIRQLILPAQNTLCLVNCVFDEQDVTLFSTRILSLTGWITPDEQAGLLDTLSAHYRTLASSHPFVPSPFVRTYLNQQRPDAFDAIVIEPGDNQPIQLGMIFLHGFTGNFTMPCWLVAQTVRVKHGLTVCPSVGWDGKWWTADGEATLHVTLDYLHQRGVSHIYLAGLSNGAVGASQLAFKLSDQIAGLILISGASPNARPSGLPVLVLAGSHDERMPAAMLRAYAEQMGNQATFVELEADHYMLAKNYQEVQSQIVSWLR